MVVVYFFFVLFKCLLIFVFCVCVCVCVFILFYFFKKKTKLGNSWHTLICHNIKTTNMLREYHWSSLYNAMFFWDEMPLVRQCPTTHCTDQVHPHRGPDGRGPTSRTLHSATPQKQLRSDPRNVTQLKTSTWHLDFLHHNLVEHQLRCDPWGPIVDLTWLWPIRHGHRTSGVMFGSRVLASDP